MRQVDDAAITAAAERRFRSDYHYALWEYLRSGKVIRALERAGVPLAGRVLDDGCGGGGTALSLAEEADFAVGIDLDARFAGTGTRLADERGVAGVAFVQGDGTRLPFRDASFELVFSHSVIEHVASAEAYLAECRRVLKPGGVLYLSTAPYLSFAGAHLPRLRLPVPVHLIVGRPAAFRFFVWMARHAPWALRERKEANTFIVLAEQGREKRDDLIEKVTLRRLEGWVAGSGFELVHEERYTTGFFRRALPGVLRRRLERVPGIQDVMIGHVQTVLRKPTG